MQASSIAFYTYPDSLVKHMKPTATRNRLLRRARSRLYTGPVKRIVRQLGFNEYLTGSYWKLVFTLADDTQTHSIAEQTISFHTETFDEFIRFRTLMGERPIVENLLQSLEPDDVFYNIGAKVGTYTCSAAPTLGPDAVVVFKPEPKSATRLKEDFNLSDLDAQVVEIAISGTSGDFVNRIFTLLNEYHRTSSGN